MVTTKKTLGLVDQTIETNQEDGFRAHLGASIIGRECSRQIWYSFHWFKPANFKARMLRLFNRGHEEEARFARWFRDAGIEVLLHDENTGLQYRISDHFGHFGGSVDAVLRGLPDMPAQYVLGEFKTSNERLFKQLVKDKVRKAKPEHFAQAQVYMYKLKLDYCLYSAVNKNTDDLHLEFIGLDKKVAQNMLDKAGYIIFGCQREPPPKINTNPRWHKCLCCTYHAICHSYELPAINCRTCAHSTPQPNINQLWTCQLGMPRIDTAPKRGCCFHLYNPSFLNGILLHDCNIEQNWIDIQLANSDQIIRHGTGEITSEHLGQYYHK